METGSKSTRGTGESPRPEPPPLVWTRCRAGFYTAGSLEITRQDGLYAPTWHVTVLEVPALLVFSLPSLRACKAAVEAARAGRQWVPAAARPFIVGDYTADADGAAMRPMARARRMLAFQEL